MSVEALRREDVGGRVHHERLIPRAGQVVEQPGELLRQPHLRHARVLEVGAAHEALLEGREEQVRARLGVGHAPQLALAQGRLGARVREAARNLRRRK